MTEHQILQKSLEGYGFTKDRAKIKRRQLTTLCSRYAKIKSFTRKEVMIQVSNLIDKRKRPNKSVVKRALKILIVEKQNLLIKKSQEENQEPGQENKDNPTDKTKLIRLAKSKGMKVDSSTSLKKVQEFLDKLEEE